MEKVEAFAYLFSSVYNNEDDSQFEALPIVCCEVDMPEVRFDKTDIMSRLEKLNVHKSCRPDGLHSRILEEAQHEPAKP
jgi:hypothetical protein